MVQIAMPHGSSYPHKNNSRRRTKRLHRSRPNAAGDYGRLVLAVLISVFLVYLIVVLFTFLADRSTHVGEEQAHNNPLINEAQQMPPKEEDQEEDQEVEEVDDAEHFDDDDNVAVNNLWHGLATRNHPPNSFSKSSKLSISIVVSHCDGELDWLLPFLSGLEDYSKTTVPVLITTTVVSKCGVVPVPNHLPRGTQLVQLPNIGRCDHTMAHWMVERIPTEPPPKNQQNPNHDEIIFFLKDNFHIHQRGSLRDVVSVLSITETSGFGCVLAPKDGISYYHETEVLKDFKLGGYSRAKDEDSFESQFDNLGAWWATMNISMPTPLTPVCYGGMYAVKMSRIVAVPMSVRKNLEKSLSRGDNIEEGHFAERSWAGLFLSESLRKPEVDKLRAISKMVYPNSDSYLGALMKQVMEFPSSSDDEEEETEPPEDELLEEEEI